MFLTIDPYYNNTFYNQCKEALENNSVKYTEFISIKQPYYWYFKLDKEPIMVNYDILENPKWLVSKVIALRTNEEYRLYRRNDDTGKTNILKYIENEPMTDARLSDYACFFNLRNSIEGKELSKEYPGKIWYFGKYFNNRYKVCLATNESIKAFLSNDRILLEKDPNDNEIGKFEQTLNYKVFLNKDYLKKYYETPYFEDGGYVLPKILKDRNVTF